MDRFFWNGIFQHYRISALIELGFWCPSRSFY